MEKTYNWKEKTILIVDDEYMNYLLFEAILEETSSILIHAMNGAIAVEECHKNKNINLVLMDIKMPVLNGYEAMKKIRKKRINLPVIAQTAYTATEDYYKCMNAGFSDYIAKPIDKDVLLRKISRYLNIEPQIIN